MTELKRSLGLLECTLLGVGVILGAGIYALIGQAASLAGNAVWISFLGAAVVAALTGLSYAELSSFIPKAGGEYYYAQRALGPFLAFLTSWLLLVGLAIASAAVALGFAGYVSQLFDIHPLWSAAILIVASSALLVYGIRESAWVAGFCTLLEVGGLLAVIAIGLPQLGSIDYFETAETGWHGIFAASTLIFFAYIGFEEIVQLSEETTDAPRRIPQAVLLSVLISTVLYGLVAIAAISVLGWQRLGASQSPMADVAAVAGGRTAFLALSTIAIFSTGNTVLILLMSSARLLYGMAEDERAPQVFARIHPRQQTPYMATAFVAVISLMTLLSLKNIGIIANLTNFAFLITFVIINLSVIVLRFKDRDTPRPFRIPGSLGGVPLVPAVGVMASCFLLTQVGFINVLIGVGCTAVGTLLFFVFQKPRSIEPPVSQGKSDEPNENHRVEPQDPILMSPAQCPKTTENT